jgi:UDP-N-acetylmuramate dehydrogenase
VSHPDVIDDVVRQLGSLAQRDVPLGPRTTYRVGGAAAVLVELRSDDDIATLSRAVSATAIDTVVVGKGSNLLVADAGFPGLAVVLGEPFAAVEVEGTTVLAGAAAALPVVARRSVAAGLTGFEWAVGVPGTIGGAVRMNAGGHGSDMSASLLGIRAVDLRSGEDGWVPSADLHLGYRTSSVRDHHLVLRADLGLRADDDPDRGQADLRDIVAWRRAHQPGGPNAGSVFTNPPGESAGRLIEAAGAKGLRHGTAVVSTKHANFIQADDGGRADDVHALMGMLIERVEAHSGIRLHPETHCVGFPDDPRPVVEG